MTLNNTAGFPPLARAQELSEALALDLLPRPLVVFNGCFDLLHAGHLQLLSYVNLAAMKGVRSTVVVLLDSDRLVRSTKGRDRPILTFAERAAALGTFPYIDYIIEIDGDKEFREVWKVLRPDIRVRGEEYKGKKSRVTCPETIWVPKLSGLSTTEICRRVVEGWLDKKEAGESGVD